MHVTYLPVGCRMVGLKKNERSLYPAWLSSALHSSADTYIEDFFKNYVFVEKIVAFGLFLATKVTTLICGWSKLQ